MESNSRNWILALPYIAFAFIATTLTMFFFGNSNGIYLLWIAGLLFSIHFLSINWNALLKMFAVLRWGFPVFGLMGYLIAGYSINVATGLMATSYPFATAVLTPQVGLMLWIFMSILGVVWFSIRHFIPAFSNKNEHGVQLIHFSQGAGAFFLAMMMAEGAASLSKAGYLNSAWVANILYYTDYQDIPKFPCAIPLKSAVIHGEDVVSFAEKTKYGIIFHAAKLSETCAKK